MGHNKKIGRTKITTPSTSKPTYNNPHFFNRQTYFETQNPTTTVLKSPPFDWSCHLEPILTSLVFHRATTGHTAVSNRSQHLSLTRIKPISASLYLYPRSNPSNQDPKPLREKVSVEREREQKLKSYHIYIINSEEL